MLTLVFQISFRRPYAPGQGQHRQTARSQWLDCHRRAEAQTQNNFSAVIRVALGTAAARK